MPIFLLQVGGAVWTVFIFLVVLAVAAVVVGVTILFLLMRNNKNRTAWRNVARSLNFSMPQPKKLEMSGEIQGCKIKVAIRTETSYTGERNRVKFFTYCASEFSHPLRFLLNISSKTSYFAGSNKMVIGQPNFDKTFDAKCYDANVLRRLLLSDFPSDKTQNLFGDLMLAKHSAGTINVTDKNVYVERSGQIGDEDVLRQMIEVTAHLAKRFEAARKSFPLADWENNLINSWQNFANQNGLVFNANYFQIQGVYKGAPIFVELETSNGKWQTEIKLKFPQNLAIGFKLMPENSVHKALTWLGVQDIELGIKPFDDTFIVKANNVEAAMWKLQPDLSSLLIGINNNASTIAIDDNEFSVTYNTVLGDQQSLKETLDAISSASRMLMR